MTDYYEPKYLRGAISKIHPVRLFFRSNYFTQSVKFPTKTVTFEYSENPRSLLPYASDDMPAPSVKRTGYQAKSYEAPLISGSRVITNDTLNMKLMGESPYNSGMTPDARARELAVNDLMELTDQLYRQEEYMCARVKQDGKLEIDGEGVHALVDYEVPNIETLTNAQKWTDSTDIISKLVKMSRRLRQNGTNPDMLIVGHDVSELFNTNKGILGLRRDEFLNYPDPSGLADGLTYICQLRAAGIYLNVYEYDEYYTDSKGELKPLIDPGTVIMQSSRERNMMLYGAVTYINQRSNQYVTEMADYVPYVVASYDPPVRKLIVSARVLPMPRDVSSWYVLKNVI